MSVMTGFFLGSALLALFIMDAFFTVFDTFVATVRGSVKQVTE